MITLVQKEWVTLAGEDYCSFMIDTSHQMILRLNRIGSRLNDFTKKKRPLKKGGLYS